MDCLKGALIDIGCLGSTHARCFGLRLNTTHWAGRFYTAPRHRIHVWLINALVVFNRLRRTAQMCSRWACAIGNEPVGASSRYFALKIER